MEKLAAVCSEMSEFVLSPYKVSLSILVHVFCETKANAKQHEIGCFSLLAIKLIQALDLNYANFLKQLKASRISPLIALKLEQRVDCIKSVGLSALIDLINNIKALNDSKIVHKSSLLGIFIRKMVLFFDKLSFSSVVRLYEDFVEYTFEKDDPLQLNDEISYNAIGDVFVFNNNKTCPKQMQFFISKQLKLMQVNEKKALSPKQLYEMLKNAETQCKQGLNPLTVQPSKRKNDLNDINFLRYLNSLRVNEYLGAKESLFAYFDGTSSQSSRCWAALNLAIFHSHFNHLQLAMESIKECISAAQEANDEKCLENALLWIATVIMKQKNKTCQDEDILSLLSHLQKKALKLELYHLAAISTLHFEKLTGLQPKSKNIHNTYSAQGLSGNPDVMAVKHSLTDVLMMTYACRSAHFALIGATKLNFLMAQSALHLHAIETIGNENVYHVNESTCISIRNVALHLWKHLALYDVSRDILLRLCPSLFSEYRSSINAIWKQALAEIEFEHHLYSKNFKAASNSVDTIRVYDVYEAKYRLAELKTKQNDKLIAFQLLDELLKQDEQANELTPFMKVRILLLKSVLLNNLSILFEAMELSKTHNLNGLEIVCKIELSRQMYELGQTEHALRLLHNIMIQLLCDGTCRDIGNAFFLQALCLKSVSENSSNTCNVEEKQQTVNAAVKANTDAIKQFKLIGDKDSLRKCYVLQSHLYHLLNNREERNHFAFQARLLG